MVGALRSDRMRALASPADATTLEAVAPMRGRGGRGEGLLWGDVGANEWVRSELEEHFAACFAHGATYTRQQNHQ